MYKCQFCENLTYDWDDAWDTEKKKEVMKIVSEHVSEHPESRPVFIGEPVFVGQPVSEIPVTPEKKIMDTLKLRRPCCRKHFLTQIDLMEKI